MLSRRENVSTADVAVELGVHAMTIRRDLAALQATGAVIRGYGSALAGRRITFEFDFDERHRRNMHAKRRIGVAAARQVRSGQTIFLDTGTTTLEVAKALTAAGTACRVITTSLVVASHLWAHSSVELLLLGGRVRPRSPDLAGPLTEAVLDSLSADIAFLGSEGLDVRRGSFAGDLESARVAHRMGQNSRRVVVVADGSKIGHAGAARYAVIGDIDEILTDGSVDARCVRALAKQNVKITQV
jgi:DeoR/GlpR family transcriptional regulator of sugar metabolism